MLYSQSEMLLSYRQYGEKRRMHMENTRSSKKKVCGLSLPDYVESYIREKAEKEHRSLSNVVALIVIDYVDTAREYEG